MAFRCSLLVHYLPPPALACPNSVKFASIIGRKPKTQPQRQPQYQKPVPRTDDKDPLDAAKELLMIFWNSPTPMPNSEEFLRLFESA